MSGHPIIDPDTVGAFAHGLKTARESRGLTQEALAELAVVSPETIQRYERATYGGHSVVTVHRILESFEVAPGPHFAPQTHALTDAERGPFDAMMRALGAPRRTLEAVYATQREAYERLTSYLRDRLTDVGPCVTSAVLVQTSGTDAVRLVSTLLESLVDRETMPGEAPSRVVMYATDARVLSSLGSSHQEKRIQALQDELANVLEAGVSGLEVRAYRTPPSLTAVPAGAVISHYLGFAYSYVKPGTSTHTSLRYTMTPRNGATVTYVYDALNRLTGASGTGSSYSYSYDPVGSMTSETLQGTTTPLTYNAANEVTNSGYAYDSNGNETSSPSNGFNYNVANQTSGVTPSGGTTVQMAYEGEGQTLRTQRGTSSYQYAKGSIDTQTDSGNTSTFVTTPDGTPLEMVLRNPWGRPTGETCPSTGYSTYVYGHDALGSVTSVISKAGSVQYQYAYDLYGNMTSGPTGTDLNPFHYIGGVWDSHTGLYKLGERYYDPSVGRFTQLDSQGGQYVYSDDDPVNLSDATGQRPMQASEGTDMSFGCQACRRVVIGVVSLLNYMWPALLCGLGVGVALGSGVAAAAIAALFCGLVWQIVWDQAKYSLPSFELSLVVCRHCRLCR